MADLLDKKTGATTKPTAAPEKQRLDLRPEVRKPPAPRIYRWIQWMAVFVVAAVVAVLAAVLLRSDEAGLTAEPYDRAAEHGEHTLMAVRDLTNLDLPRFVGLDANLDPDVVAEHGAFTVMAVRDLSGLDFYYRWPGIDGLAVVGRHAGLDANLDPDYASPEHGEFTIMETRDLAGLELPRFGGDDAGLD